jgi:hypothetical protein
LDTASPRNAQLLQLKDKLSTTENTAPQAPTHSQIATMDPQLLLTQSRNKATPPHFHLRPPSRTNGDALLQAQTRSQSEVFKKDATPKTSPTLMHEWIGFSPRNLSCNRCSGSDWRPQQEERRPWTPSPSLSLGAHPNLQHKKFCPAAATQQSDPESHRRRSNWHAPQHHLGAKEHHLVTLAPPPW